MKFGRAIVAWLGCLVVQIGQIMHGLVVDAHLFLDEKKLWGALYLIAALVAVFTLTVDSLVIIQLVLFGLALYLGVAIGDLTPGVYSLRSLGLFDLITNKANQGDPSRLFGNLFLAAGLVYLFWPLIKPGFVVNPEYISILGIVGVSLLGVALVGDKTAVHVANSTYSGMEKPGSPH